MKRSLILCAVLLCAVAVQGQVRVENVQTFTHPKLAMTVVSGDVKLPAGGVWVVDSPELSLPVRQIMLSRRGDETGDGDQRRFDSAIMALAPEMVQQQSMQTMYSMCAMYAIEHDGRTPASRAELEGYGMGRRDCFDPDNYFVVPGVVLAEGEDNPAKREIMVVEVRPAQNDGMHWVACNDGTIERRRIDDALLKKHNLAIRPLTGVKDAAPQVKEVDYTLRALLADASATKATITFRNRTSKKTVTIEWALQQAQPGNEQMFRAWATQRAAGWTSTRQSYDAPVLEYWLSRAGELYGVDASRECEDRRWREGRETADAFSILGGRAAVRETLQMQAIRDGGSERQTQSVPLSALPALDVKSHPFAEMLGGAEGGSLPLADLIPADHAFVYVAKPSALFGFINAGADFIFNAGSMALQDNIAYNLKDKYLARLGLDEGWIRGLEKAGVLKEMVLATPDLFLIDGTEVSVIAHVTGGAGLKAALAIFGLGDLGNEVKTLKTKSGRPSYWMMDGERMYISTSLREMETLKLVRQSSGMGSLGKSAEFRYMLTQLPVTAKTTGFVYFSDPFIRRLVSPAMKIGQLRRLKVRAELEMMSAAALLWKLDGHPGTPDAGTLIAQGYLPGDFNASGYLLKADLSAESSDYGAPGNMKSLVEAPVSLVTPGEQEAYTQYVQNYARFWRQYFDPIAFRLEDVGDAEMKLTTFILPLIDSSIYNGLKQGLQAEQGAPLKIPQTDPSPVLSLSLNLNASACAQLSQGLSMLVGDEMGPAAPLNLGPSLHLIVSDRDPIVTFGGGDILGAFGGNWIGGRGTEMMAIPIALSVLTRPCEIMIEAQDPQAVRTALRRMVDASLSRTMRGELAVDAYRQADRDEWVLSLGLEGMAKIRFGVGVKDKYVVLRNMPWNSPVKLLTTTDAELGAAALVAYPEAGIQQFPSLYMAAKERERYAALQGSMHLYPLFLCGAKSVDEAGAMCSKMFGFVPEHPKGGSWAWEGGRVQSNVFGDTYDPVQPAYTPQSGAFGVFEGITRLAVNLQFEQEGLRVVTSWKTKP
ncbi:MAG TPA: hypothetical protein PLE77_04090 [Kiritimatiellia bacterium]|nr:hypothetical protein [Kiritimatiellia bacterium]